MSNLPFAQPLLNGVDHVTSAVHAAPVMRVTYDPPSLEVLGHQTLASVMPMINAWVLSQRQMAQIGGVAQWGTGTDLGAGVTITYSNNQGTEIVDVLVRVQSSSNKQSVDTGNIWRIGTDDTSPPFAWDGSMRTQAALYSLLQWPQTNKNTFLSGVYTKELKDKVYWEVEIEALPTQGQQTQTTTSPGSDDCTYINSMIQYQSNVLRVDKWPDQFHTYLEPQIGLVPDKWFNNDAKEDRHICQDFILGQRPLDLTPPVDIRPISCVMVHTIKDQLQTHSYTSAQYYWEMNGDPSKTTTLAGPNIWQDYNPCVGPDPASAGLAYSGFHIGVDQTRIYVCFIGNGMTGYFNAAPHNYDFAHFGPLDGSFIPDGPSFTQTQFDQFLLDYPSLSGSHGYSWGKAEWYRPWIVGDTAWRDKTTHAVALSGPDLSPYPTVYDTGTIKYKPGSFKDTYTDLQVGDTSMPFGTRPDGDHCPVIKGIYTDLVSAPPTNDPADSPHDDYTSSTGKGVYTGNDLGFLKEKDVVMIAVDTKTRMVWFGKNGVWADGANPTKGDVPTTYLDKNSDDTPVKYFPAVSIQIGICWVKMHFGVAMKYAVPGGFAALGAQSVDITP